MLPLMRGVMVHLGGNLRICIDFKYEKFSNYCNLCIVLGHVERKCSLGLENKGS